MELRRLWWATLILAACSGGNEAPEPGPDASEDVVDAGGVSGGDDGGGPDADDASAADVAEDTPSPDVVEDVPATGDVWDGGADRVASDTVRLALAGGEASGGGLRLRCALSWAPTATVASGEDVQMRPPLAAGAAVASTTEGGE